MVLWTGGQLFIGELDLHFKRDRTVKSLFSWTNAYLRLAGNIQLLF